NWYRSTKKLDRLAVVLAYPGFRAPVRVSAETCRLASANTTVPRPQAIPQPCPTASLQDKTTASYRELRVQSDRSRPAIFEPPLAPSALHADWLDLHPIFFVLGSCPWRSCACEAR